MSGEINNFELNSVELNGEGTSTYESFNNPVFLILKQKVGVYSADTALLTLKQNVIFKSLATSNTIVTLKQRVIYHSDKTELITLRQNVRNLPDTTIPTFFESNGYDVSISVGSLSITTKDAAQEYGLTDRMTITGGEGLARRCVFTIIPPEAPVDFNFYQGKKVVCYQTDYNGNTFRAFTGWVESISIDFIGRKITLDCSDRRQDRLLDVSVSTVKSIGTYSDTVFGVAKDIAEEMNSRLQTVPSSYDFDAYGEGKLTAWQPKDTEDYNFSGEPVYYRNPTLSFTNIGKNVNVVDLEVNYNYTRCHHQSCAFTWLGFDDWVEDWFLAGKPSFPSKDMITSAADNGAGGWFRTSLFINFVDLWPAEVKGYNGQVLVWQPNEVTRTYKGRTKFMGYAKDSTGAFITTGSGADAKLVPVILPVLDSKGHQIMDLESEHITDTAYQFCRGASWSSAIHFTQTVHEKYTIRLQAPQAVSKYGRIKQTQALSLDAPYDTQNWESTKSQGISNFAANFYINQKTNVADLSRAINVALSKAKTDILKAHRDVEVNFRLKKLWPQLDLQHTIKLDVTDPVPSSGSNVMEVKGKVSSVIHTIDFDREEAYTEVTIKGSRSSGSATNEAWNIARPQEAPSYIGSAKGVVLGTHLGEDPDPLKTSLAPTWNGFIGNKTITSAAIGAPGSTNTVRTQYPEQFIADYPEIAEFLRQDITYYSDNDFDIAIPNDTKNVGF